MQGNELRKKKKVSTKKKSKISKKSSPRASDTGKGSYKHNAPDLWDRGSMYIQYYKALFHKYFLSTIILMMLGTYLYSM